MAVVCPLWRTFLWLRRKGRHSLHFLQRVRKRSFFTVLAIRFRERERVCVYFFFRALKHGGFMTGSGSLELVVFLCTVVEWKQCIKTPADFKVRLVVCFFFFFFWRFFDSRKRTRRLQLKRFIPLIWLKMHRISYRPRWRLTRMRRIT